MRAAARITREAHEGAMAPRRARGCTSTRSRRCSSTRSAGTARERPAYGSIVGSGPNASVLHYRKNDRRIERGRSAPHRCRLRVRLLRQRRDAHLPGRAARFPASSRPFTSWSWRRSSRRSRRSRAGATLDAIHARSVDVITRGLVRLGLLAGRVETAHRNEALQALLHAPHQPLAGHGRARRRRVLRRAARRARSSRAWC